MEAIGVVFNNTIGAINVSELNNVNDPNDYVYYMHRGNRYYFKSIHSSHRLSFIHFEKLPFKYHDTITINFDYGKNETP